MSDPVSEALEQRERSKADLKSSVATLKARLTPATLRKDVTEKIKQHSEKALETTLEKVGERPALTASVVAALTLFVLRKPLIGAWKRLSKEK